MPERQAGSSPPRSLSEKPSRAILYIKSIVLDCLAG